MKQKFDTCPVSKNNLAFADDCWYSCNIVVDTVVLFSSSTLVKCNCRELGDHVGFSHFPNVSIASVHQVGPNRR